MNFFLAFLSVFFSPISKSGRGQQLSIPDHVAPLLDDLIGVVNCNDISLVFKLLDVTMRTADAISFQHQEQEQLEQDQEQQEGHGKFEGELEFDVRQKEPAARADRGNGIVEEEEEDEEGDELEALTQTDLIEIGLGQKDRAKSADPDPNLFADPFSLFDSDAFVVAPDTNLSSATASATDGVLQPQSTDFSLFPEFSIVSADTNPNPNLNPNESGVAEIPLTQTKPTSNLIQSPSPQTAKEKRNKESKFLKWLNVRQGISCERVDSERARLTRSMDTLDLSFQATHKFFRKCRRKIESECFLESHR